MTYEDFIKRIEAEDCRIIPASTLAAMHQEIANLRHEAGELVAQYATSAAEARAEAAEQQVRDMRAVLEPFARVGDILELRAGGRPNSDDDPVTEWEDHRVGARRLTVGDFRRARLLLKEGRE